MSLCPCGSGLETSACCLPIINASRQARTAIELMRARYTAYTLHNIDFIWDSTHPDQRDLSDRQAMENWSAHAEWLGLTILDEGHANTSRLTDEVEFKVTFRITQITHLHHERSQFCFENNQWWFVEGQQIYSGPLERPRPVVRNQQVGRNDPCPCGSGTKFKKCCGNRATVA